MARNPVSDLRPRPAATCRDGAVGVAEAAEWLGVSAREIWRLVAAGKLSHKRHGRRCLIPRVSLVRFLEAGLVVGDH